jgi:hypothetical protein
MLTGFGAPTRRTRVHSMHKLSCLPNLGPTSRAVAFVVAALSCSLVADPTMAQSANHVFSNCQLNTSLAGLTADLQTAGISSPTIDFVVVYSLANPNDGQVVSGGFSGPVLCRGPSVDVAPETGTDPIPGAVNLRDIETALITQYVSAGQTRKRFCHSVNVNSDCFAIQPSAPD